MLFHYPDLASLLEGFSSSKHRGKKVKSHLAVQIALKHVLSVTFPNSGGPSPSRFVPFDFAPFHAAKSLLLGWISSTDAALPSLATMVESGLVSSV